MQLTERTQIALSTRPSLKIRNIRDNFQSSCYEYAYACYEDWKSQKSRTGRKSKVELYECGFIRAVGWQCCKGRGSCELDRKAETDEIHVLRGDTFLMISFIGYTLGVIRFRIFSDCAHFYSIAVRLPNNRRLYKEK